MKTVVLVLVLLAAGLAGGYFARPQIEPLVGGPREVEGVVVAERTEDDRLVLTLRVADETMLATFHNRAGDIAELVSPGDTITLRVRGTSVFADDAPIVRVARPGDAAAETAGPEVDADADADAGVAPDAEPEDPEAPTAPEDAPEETEQPEEPPRA